MTFTGTMAGQSRSATARIVRLVAAVSRTLPGAMSRALTLSVLTGFTEGIGTLLLIPLLGSVGLDVSSGSVGRLGEAVLNLIRWTGLSPTLGPVLTLYVVVVATQALVTRQQLISSLALEHRFVAAARKQVYAAVARAQWTFQHSLRRSDVAHVLIQELDRTGVATSQLLLTASNFVIAVVYVAIAARVSLLMTMMVVAAGAGVLLALRGRVQRAGARGEAVSDETRQLFASVSEHLAAMRLVKSLAFEERQIASVGQTADRIAAAQANAVQLHAGSRTTLEIGGVVSLAALLYAGLTWLALDAGGVILLLYVFARLMPRLSALQQSVQHVSHYLPAYAAVETLLLEAESARETLASGQADLTPFSGGFRFERVSYTHPGKHEPAVDDVSFEVPPNGFVAIVGASGAGKSTIADLVCGLLRPESGRIVADGHRLDERILLQWRQGVAYVEQDAFLFNDTIRANLQWILPGATDEDLRRALELASAGFVFDLPQRLSTVIGDRGSHLSGGERQRLALARALLRKPRLLVLDEPTSALDPVNEARVLDAIERLAGQLTIVLITHRMAAVRRAGTILVVDAGRLVEGGDWSTLSGQQTGRFRALCEAQHVALATGDTQHRSA
jgi:ATP-binding cassette subfamily C protein